MARHNIGLCPLQCVEIELSQDIAFIWNKIISHVTLLSKQSLYIYKLHS